MVAGKAVAGKAVGVLELRRDGDRPIPDRLERDQLISSVLDFATV
jgi:hypothetical protein